MYRTQVYAKNIKNLTDARYFSARQVEWMSFQLPEMDYEKAKEWFEDIIQWVEGPYFALHLSEIRNDQLNALARHPKIQGLQILAGMNDPIAQKYLFREVHLSMDLDKEALILHTNAILLNAKDELGVHHPRFKEWITFCFQKNVPIWLELPLDTELDPLLEQYFFQGIVLEGGQEEKTGVQVYDQIDKILDALEL